MMRCGRCRRPAISLASCIDRNAALAAASDASERMSASPSRAAFTTRFLPSDGIPAYNALLDNHLGKRREFLLGNKQSLRLLQQTGAIARVEAASENPNQYVVHMRSDDDRRPRRSVAAASTTSSSSTLRRSDSLSTVHKAASTRRATDPSTATAVASTTVHTEDHRVEQPNDDDHLVHKADDASHELPMTSQRQQRPMMMTMMGRSQSTTALFGKTFRIAGSSDDSASTSDDPQSSSRPPTTSAVIDRLRRRRRRLSVDAAASSSSSSSRLEASPLPLVVASRANSASTSALPRAAAAPTTTTTTAAKRDTGSVVERLLENDAAFQLQIQLLRDELQALEREKAALDAQVATMRRRLRGVNAVHENDVAVAHCCAIMTQRLAKTEEEYMKSVTAQQQVKTDIDTLRRELLAMRKVARKLEDDIADVAATNSAIDGKIRAAKATRNALSAELSELERQAELAAVEQRLKLPPTEDVDVDPDALMSAVQRRNVVSRSSPGRRPSSRVAGSMTTAMAVAVSSDDHHRAVVQRMLSERGALFGGDSSRDCKPLLPFRSAFRVLLQTLEREDEKEEKAEQEEEGDEEEEMDVDAWVQRFAESEDQLLSQHNANVQLQEEVAQLEREAAALADEVDARHATIRGAQQASQAKQHELQAQVEAALSRIESFNALRELRNQEHARLRGIMQRCLEILHAEKLVSRQESLGGPLLLSELSSPAMLEALQKKMTEVAIMLKLTRHSKSESGADAAAEAATAAWQTTGKTMRRSNLFAKREAASKIVLGPKEPSGTAHAAILLTAQPPTVEGAQALAETYAAAMHQLHPSVIPHATDVSVSMAAAAANGNANHKRPSHRPTRLTIARAASIRAGKRKSAAVVAFGTETPSLKTETSNTSDGSRRVSAPIAASAVSILQPSTRARTLHRLLTSSSGSSDSMIITAEDAMARVVEHTDELDA